MSSRREHDLHLAGQSSHQRLCREDSYPHKPLVTGTRIIDTFFPVAEGGNVLHPRSFRFGQNGPPADHQSLRPGRRRHHRRLR